jgi:hypothetical protein
MSTFPAGYVPYEEASVRVAFDNCSVVAHPECPVWLLGKDNPMGSRLTGN